MSAQNTENIKRICRTCKAEFTISFKERQWLKDMGFELPAHCLSCRKARRANKQEEENVQPNS